MESSVQLNYPAHSCIITLRSSNSPTRCIIRCSLVVRKAIKLSSESIAAMGDVFRTEKLPPKVTPNLFCGLVSGSWRVIEDLKITARFRCSASCPVPASPQSPAGQIRFPVASGRMCSAKRSPVSGALADEFVNLLDDLNRYGHDQPCNQFARKTCA